MNVIESARAGGRSALAEAEGKALLAQYGIAVPNTVVVAKAADVAGAVSGMKFPVVVKVVSPDILHKSDAGGVRVNLQSDDEVRAAIAAMAGLPKIRSARV